MLRRPRDGSFRKLMVLLALLLEPGPSSAWYKHVASRRYHTVGRASGLLMGVRRSPYMWRREEGHEEPALTLAWDYQQQDSPEGSKEEVDGDGGTLEIGGKAQAAYSKPAREKSDLTRAIQLLTSNGAVEEAATYRMTQTPPQRYIGKADKISSGMQGPVLSQSPEEVGSMIGSSFGKRTPETTGTEDNIPPYNTLSHQESGMDKGKVTPKQLILALYSKWAPEDSPDKETSRQYVQEPSNKQTPETDMESKVEMLYRDRTNRKNGVDGVTNTLKGYISTLYNKRIPEESVMSADTEASNQYVPAPYTKRIAEETNMGTDLEMPNRYLLAPNNKWASSEKSMGSDQKTPITRWVPEEMETGKNGPLLMQTQDRSRHLLVPYPKWSSLKMGVGSGMQALDRTDMNRYFSSSFPKGTLEETGVDRQDAYLKHRWPQEEAGIMRDTQLPYVNSRKA